MIPNVDTKKGTNSHFFGEITIKASPLIYGFLLFCLILNHLGSVAAYMKVNISEFINDNKQCVSRSSWLRLGLVKTQKICDQLSRFSFNLKWFLFCLFMCTINEVVR